MEKQETLKLIKTTIITPNIIKHCLLHLQMIRRELDRYKSWQPDARTAGEIKQIEFDLYELGQHLGYSPFEINEEKI